MKDLSKYLAVVLGLLLLGGLIYYFQNIVAYVLIAWVLSMIGQPLMKFFQARIHLGKFKAGRTISAVLVLLCYFVLAVLLVWMFVPLIVEQARNLSEVKYDQIAATLEEPLAKINQWLGKLGFVEGTKSPADQVAESLKAWFDPATIGNFFGSILGIASNILFSLFSIVFITFFFLKEQGLFTSFIVALAPNKYDTEIRSTLDNISRLLTRYFGGILIQMTVITFFVSIALSILGVKNALLIGFFAALINVIPYVGPIIGAMFAVIITISSNLDMTFTEELLPLIIRVVIVFGLMQMLDNFLLQPYIFSNSVLAHPLEIFIVILMGAQLNGIVGMVLAIPFYTVIRVVARSFLSEFHLVQKLTGGMDDVA